MCRVVPRPGNNKQVSQIANKHQTKVFQTIEVHCDSQQQAEGQWNPEARPSFACRYLACSHFRGSIHKDNEGLRRSLNLVNWLLEAVSQQLEFPTWTSTLMFSSEATERSRQSISVSTPRQRDSPVIAVLEFDNSTYVSQSSWQFLLSPSISN